MENINFQPVFDYLDATLEKSRFQASQELDQKLGQRFTQYSRELDDKLDQRFAQAFAEYDNKLDQRFAQHTTKVLSSVFEYFDSTLENRFMEQKIEIVSEIRNDFNERFDGISKQLQGLIDEMHVNNHRVTRLESWAVPVGKKAKIPFEY